jgi:putative oxidoreductase
MIPERFAPLTYALFRIVFGLLFLMFGLQKTAGLFGGQAIPIVPITRLGMAGVIETACGFLILIGLFTRPAALLASGEMAAAYFLAHFPQSPIPIVNMGERAAMFCFAFLYIATRGAGIASIDALMGGRSSRR